MGLIAFLLIGLVAGLLARALMPGKQGMGLLATTLLGMAGSLMVGLLGSLFPGGRLFSLQPPGILMSVLGAVLILLVVGMAGGGRRRVGN
ncbi:MAG: GlsB/YeaQ/YmgE family stress response membrane protein [Deltaproteobacteria bacterium]|nr:GlsB/YeaQ/YmgE family stress response membrane protein [Deltaproteobacteria bacterium]